MIVGYNHLSQALLITYDQYEMERKLRESNDENNTPKCSVCGSDIMPINSKNSPYFKKQLVKRLEKMDYTINSIEY